MPRGGRRRGAGAPFGNVNALVSARSSPRYKMAFYFVVALDPLREYAMAKGDVKEPAGRQRLQQAMDVAASILRNVPDLPDRIEEVINTNFKGHGHAVDVQPLRQFIQFLDRPVQTHAERLGRALDFVAWCRKYHQPTYAIVRDFLMDYVDRHLEYQEEPGPASKNPQSNNQSIKHEANPQPWSRH